MDAKKISMDRTLCALSVVTDHQAVDILRKARQDLCDSHAELSNAKKSLFWLRFTSSLPQVIRDFAKKIQVCECVSCKYLATGYMVGSFLEIDLTILNARHSCLFKKQVQDLAHQCPGLFRQEPNVSNFLTLDEDLGKQDPWAFESLDTFLQFVARLYGNEDASVEDLKTMKRNLASVDPLT